MDFIFYVLLGLNFLGIINAAPKAFEEFERELHMLVGELVSKPSTIAAKKLLWKLALQGVLTSEEACHFLYYYLPNNFYPFSEGKFIKFKDLILQIYLDNDNKKSFEHHFTRFEFEKFRFYKENTSEEAFFGQVASALCLDPQDISLKSDVDSLVRSLIFQEFDFEGDEFNDFLSYFVDWMTAEKSFDRENIDLDKFKYALVSGFAEMFDRFDQRKAEGLRNFWFNSNYTDMSAE